MTRVLKDSYRSFSCLFTLNWDSILFFGATALALLACWYLLIAANLCAVCDTLL
ncbi:MULTISPECIES: hypothetical protein [unclassified Ruegeria]|uniref:hypothetical protein n=1 Tax=unclassified Ruegeria TaxID=2625375 RepID=UPI001ADA97EB|nr:MULTISPECIES: hypothetical protein [unclassified Ruegeria]MBO9413317.1 hypothetical protein [Ruegeria sp. R8_1]MBO9413981.1 hypothetical protein [Ruegeria sp. R8_2]